MVERWDYKTMDQAYVDEHIEDACEKLNEVRQILEELGINEEPAFHAYVACHLEGERRSWMGGPFLIDEIRKFHSNPDECQ